MPELVSVVKFADGERDVLTGDTGDRALWAKNIGAELTTLVKAVHKSVRDVGSITPGRQDLREAAEELNRVDSILQVLPDSESVNALRAAQEAMRTIVHEGLAALSG